MEGMNSGQALDLRNFQSSRAWVNSGIPGTRVCLAAADGDRLVHAKGKHFSREMDGWKWRRGQKKSLVKNAAGKEGETNMAGGF